MGSKLVNVLPQIHIPNIAIKGHYNQQSATAPDYVVAKLTNVQIAINASSHLLQCLLISLSYR
jgi:hypothetical protein